MLLAHSRLSTQYYDDHTHKYIALYYPLIVSSVEASEGKPSNLCKIHKISHVIGHVKLSTKLNIDSLK